MGSEPENLVAASIWKNEDANFDFEQHELPKVPRAWERVQKPAFNQNRKGRTVWKRPEIRGTGSYLETSHDSDTISRSVKRQKHMPQRSLRASARNQHQYISTMEDQAPGTPRRKSVKKQRCKRLSLILGGDNGKTLPRGTDYTASEEAAISKLVREQSIVKGASTITTMQELGGIVLSQDNCHSRNPVLAAIQRSLRRQSRASSAFQEMESEDLRSKDLALVMGENGHASSDDSSQYKDIKTSSPTPALQEQAITNCGSPCVESSLQDASLEYSTVTAKKEPGHATSTAPTLEGSEKRTRRRVSKRLSQRNQKHEEDAEPGTGSGPATMLSDAHMRSIPALSNLPANTACVERVNQPSLVLANSPCTPEESSEMETAAVLPTGTVGGSQSDNTVLLDGVAGTLQALTEADSAGGQHICLISGNSSDTVPILQGPGQGWLGKTRSGNRYSDDTSMLKDFLNRAQAKKAALSSQAQANAAGLDSPRRSPRQVLGWLDNNSPLLPKIAATVSLPAGTPPLKLHLAPVDFDDMDELGRESASCRRSTRSRVLAPAKMPAGVPSFIPVRRADGTETVVLPKSAAQELAMVTRSNTRRNRGQSKMPKFVIRTLEAEGMSKEGEVEEKEGKWEEKEEEEEEKKRKKKEQEEEREELAMVVVGTSAEERRAKAQAKAVVHWDLRLAYFQDGAAAVEGQVQRGSAEKVEKAGQQRRRPRGVGLGLGLGAVKGTPAQKRVPADADVNANARMVGSSMAVGTPAVGRRLKSRDVVVSG